VAGIECPACGTANDGDAEAFCPWCGLELRGSEAAAIRLLAQQLGEVDRELFEVAERRARLAADLSSRQWNASRGATRPQPARPRPAEELLPRSPAPRSPEWSVDRVRSLLLWVGAALLAASALTFTAVAWARLGDGGRALLLVAVTALSVGGALALARRLPATAEAFTALSIALALIDWHALRRAGVSDSLSGTAWWAIGSVVVSAFAFALGNAVGRRTTRVTIALLLPLSLELTVGTVAGAAWSAALGCALIAGAAAFAVRRLHARADDAVARSALMVHVVGTWCLAAGLVLAAVLQAHTLVEVLVPAVIVLALAAAPAALLRRDMTTGNFQALATLVCAAPAGALVVVASTSLGPQGMLAWATVVGAAAIVLSPLLPGRWTSPAWIVGGVVGGPGLVFGVTGALTAIFGPLAWLREAWEGTLGAPARAVYAGPRTTEVWRFGGPALVALGAAAFAVAGAGVGPTARRREPVSSTLWGSVLTLTTLALCLAPLVGGASAAIACATATFAVGALLVGAAVLDRARRQDAVVPLFVATLPAIAAIGWAAMTPGASIAALAVICVVLVSSTAVAASDAMRGTFGALAGATALALAGIATAASGRAPATAGFAVAVGAAVVVIIGVHGRWKASEGVALEFVGAAGLVVGPSIAAQQTNWLAAALTVIVPLLAVAGLRRARAHVYAIAAGSAALGATWAWLAAAHVTVAEAYTVPAAVVALGVGLLEWRRGPARSWLALGPAIVSGLGPTLVIGIARDDTIRTVATAVVALAIVGFGAAGRLQAPLVLGTGALLALAVDTFGPSVARLPRWLSLAVVGVLLMWLGATFEKRRDRARRATRGLLRFG
jgi:hypothetical protein